MRRVVHPAARRDARGLTLIELMIAVLLSSLLALGLVEVFSASRTAYQLSQGVARAQENGRFAMGFLLRDLRMAGHTGCVNDQALTMPGGGGINVHFNTAQFPLRFDVAVQGFEADSTGPSDTFNLPATRSAGSAGDWTPALPAPLAGLAPIQGSDIIMLRFLAPVGTNLATFSAIPGNPVTASPVAAGAKVVTEFAATRSLFGIANCRRVSMFQATSIDGNTGAMTINGSAGMNVSAFSGEENYTGGAVLYRAHSVAYYVALNGQGKPALYRTYWRAAPGADALTADTQELVEGVESIQFLYGEGRLSAGGLPTGYIEQVSSADTMGTPISDADDASRWRQVGTVQIGILTRSSEAAGVADNPNASVLGVAINPPDDAHYRSTYETTVALRNRMFGN